MFATVIPTRKKKTLPYRNRTIFTINFGTNGLKNPKGIAGNETVFKQIRMITTKMKGSIKR